MVLRSEFFRRNQENSREKLFFFWENQQFFFFFKAHDLFKYTAMTPQASLGGERIK